MDLAELAVYNEQHKQMLEHYKADSEFLLESNITLRLFDAYKSAEKQRAKDGSEFLILILPGGAYEFTSFREGHIVAQTFQKLGCSAAVLNYHTKTVQDVRESQKGLEFTPLYDVALAIDELRHNELLGFTKHKIIVCGFSAGGHLAASITTLFNHPKLLDLHNWRGSLRPDGAILSYPVICSNPEIYHDITFECISGSQDPQVQEFYSLEKHVTKDTPPCFLWHTADDQAVNVQNSIVFANAMWKLKNTAMLEVFPHGEHGSSVATDDVNFEHNFALADDLIATWPKNALHFCRKFV